MCDTQKFWDNRMRLNNDRKKEIVHIGSLLAGFYWLPLQCKLMKLPLAVPEQKCIINDSHF